MLKDATHIINIGVPCRPSPRAANVTGRKERVASVACTTIVCALCNRILFWTSYPHSYRAKSAHEQERSLPATAQSPAHCMHMCPACSPCVAHAHALPRALHMWAGTSPSRTIHTVWTDPSVLPRPSRGPCNAPRTLLWRRLVRLCSRRTSCTEGAHHTPMQ